MIIERDGRSYNVLFLALFPGIFAGSIVWVASFLIWEKEYGDWPMALAALVMVYSLFVTISLVDILATAFTRNRAERAQQDNAFRIFMAIQRADSIAPSDQQPELGQLKRQMKVTDKNGPRVLTWYEDMDPAEKNYRQSLIDFCMWAAELGLEGAALYGPEPDKPLGNRPAEWVRATNDLRDIGGVHKGGPGVPARWSDDWTPDKMVTYLRSGSPMPVNLKKRPLQVKAWLPPALRSPAPASDGSAALSGPENGKG